jgi:hypothetical protein
METSCEAAGVAGSSTYGVWSGLKGDEAHKCGGTVACRVMTPRHTVARVVMCELGITPQFNVEHASPERPCDAYFVVYSKKMFPSNCKSQAGKQWLNRGVVACGLRVMAHDSSSTESAC